MFAYIKGVVEYATNEYLIIENSGIGFKVYSSLSTLDKLSKGKEAKIFTYMYVREDNIGLFGFLTQEEIRIFELLISISGIGPKAAVSVLSSLSPSKFSLAVITGDVALLKSVPGIGLKTAQRIILELKDKMKTEDGIEKMPGESIEPSDVKLEAINALQVLGYSAQESAKALQLIDAENADIETIIKQALKYFSR